MGVIHGGTVIEGAAQRIRRASGALGSADTGGGVVSWQNPEDVAIIVTRLVLDITTKSTAACTLDAGPGATATTVADTLIDGLDANAAAGVFDNIEDQGTNGKSTARLDEAGGTTDYLTVSKKTGAAAGIVGNYHIFYILTDD